MWKGLCLFIKRSFFSLLLLVPLLIIYKSKPDFIIPYLTFVAIIVALFREKILGYLFPPILTISLTNEPGHFAIVEARNLNTGEFVDYHLSIGVLIKNVGKAKADNVALYFTGLESNVIDSFDRYVSIPMLRSWLGGLVTIGSLPRKIPMRFDIGYITCKEAKQFNFNFAFTPNALRGINCKCNTQSDKPHKYPTYFKFEIKAVCDNASVSRAVIKIDYDCNWKDGIGISLE
jgi:hypothetical protein